jgi:4-aminobutyrate aminotransferase/(S)-3-amino-2-methylpropionate transaminase
VTGAQAGQPAGGAGEETRLTGRSWVRGAGSVLTDSAGRDCVDLGAGTLTQPLGHCHPAVVAAVRDQAGVLENVHDCPTPVRSRAAAALRRLLPGHLGAVSFFSTGAEAVEGALRLVAAATAQVAPGRRRVAALRRGFHGKTRGGRGLVQWDVGTEAPSAATLGYPGYCYRCPFGLTRPGCDLLCARLTVREVVARADVAALVAEPVQGAAGVIVPPDGYWEIVADGCRRAGVLLVADEVLTGGGRTGRFLAAERFGFEPDVVTLAKGIGSGYPVSAVAARDALATPATWAAAGGESTTFAGSAVPLAAAAATLETLAAGVLDRVDPLAAVLADGLAALGASPVVGEIRQVGLLAAIELVADRHSRTPAPELAGRVVARAAEFGVRVLPGGHVLRLAPPFVIGADLLADGVRRLNRAVREVAAAG